MDYLKRRPIKLQLLIIFILFVSVVAVVMLLTYSQSKEMIYDKNEEYSIELLDKITQYIQSQIENIDGLVINTSYNMDVHQYLKSTDLIDKIDVFKKVDSQITTISQLEKGIVDMTIIGENGNNVNLMSNKSKRKMVMDTIEEIKKSPDIRLKPYYAGLKEMVDNGVGHDYFIIGSRIKNIYPSLTLGYLIVILDLDALFPKFNTMLENGFGDFYVLDRNGTVSSSNDRSMIGEKLDTTAIKDRTEYIIRTAELPDLQGRIVNIYSKQNLFRGLEKIKVMYGWILLIFIPFMCLLLWVISRNVLDPIKSFMRFIQAQKVKNIYHRQKRIELIGYNEIMIMAERFNGMLDEIDHLTDEVVSSETRIVKLELLKKEVELAFLKQQVNPHFLYNMLESLRGMANEAGVMDIRDMVAALGKMLRYSIKGQDVVKLGQELDIAKSYLKLQHFRFEDRFDFHIEFPEALLRYRVIKMIFQPILENAITHGLESRMVKGNLWLGGQMTLEGDIVIRIKDDGLGMTSEKLASIQAELDRGKDLHERINSHDNEHLGIVNVHNRIRTAYGPPYGLRIVSEENKGTEVQLLLPQRGEEANA